MKTNVTLYVVPSVWVNQWSNKIDEPYQRIVGIKTNQSTIWAKVYDNGDPEVSYLKSNTKQINIELPELMVKRLSEFFVRYFVNEPEAKDKYNCHRFAYWMTGQPSAKNLRRPRAPYPSITNKALVKGGLPLGDRGVWILNKGKKSVHSVIGLGKEKDIYLQVLAFKGYLAICDYSNLKEYFEKEFDGPVDLYR